jgi:hypothetical protein
MTIQRTTWGPDTCECRLVYEWDDAVDESLRIHTLAEVLNKCAAHSTIVDLSLLQSVVDENRRKNITPQLAIAQMAALGTDITQRWFTWTYTAGRVLQVTFTGVVVPTATKNKIQNACDLQFGPGKVQIM